MNKLSCLPFSKALGFWQKGQQRKERSCQLAVVGDTGSGKTSLIFRFSRGRMPDIDESLLSPLATDKMEVLRNSKTIHLAVYDTSGDDAYAKVRALTYSHVDGVILCFPLDSPESLQRLQSDWAPEVRHLCRRKPFLLVGTKKDLRVNARSRSRQVESFVTKKQGKRTAKNIGAIAYLECSALEATEDGKEVKRVFGRAIRESLKRQ